MSLVVKYIHDVVAYSPEYSYMEKMVIEKNNEDEIKKKKTYNRTHQQQLDRKNKITMGLITCYTKPNSRIYPIYA